MGTLIINSTGNDISCKDDLRITGGAIDVGAAEAIEATIVQVIGGVIGIYATDDGVSISYESSSLEAPILEINGGELAQGDTDALDSSGYPSINGGTVDISVQFASDFNLGAEPNGSPVYINDEQVLEIADSMMMVDSGGP